MHENLFVLNIRTIKKVLNSGSNANNEAKCSLFYFNANNDSGNANVNIGSQLELYSVRDFYIALNPAVYHTDMRDHTHYSKLVCMTV